jgi:hypothetical protein
MDVTAISSTGYTRSPVAQTGVEAVASGAESSADATNTAATSVKSGSTPAQFISPVYKFDPVAQLDVLTFRNTSTGDVTVQYPAEKVVEQYRRTHGEPPSTGANGTGTGTT